MTVSILAGTFGLLACIGVPIAFAMAGATLVTLLIAMPQTPLVVAVSVPLQGIDQFVYLAIPLFVFAGTLMEKSGISQRLVRLSEECVGWFPGGLNLSVVLATILFSGTIGSKLAEASALGTVVFPRLRETGQPEAQSVSIVAAASAMGEMVPPAVLMIILATLANQSVAKLFVASAIPALVMAATLAIVLIVQALMQRSEWRRFHLRRTILALLEAIPALCVPVVVIGSLISGFANTTEAGAVAVAIVLVVGTVYRQLPFSEIPAILLDAARTSAMAMFIIATASALGYILAMNSVPQAIGSWFLGFSSSPILFMIFSSAVFIILGSVLEGLPAVLIFLPIFLPIASQLHINPIQYLVTIVGASGIGIFLPPVGVGVNLLAGLGHATIRSVIRPITPLIGSQVIALLLIILFPAFSLSLIK